MLDNIKRFAYIFEGHLLLDCAQYFYSLVLERWLRKTWGARMIYQSVRFLLSKILSTINNKRVVSIQTIRKISPSDLYIP
jgi:hypothetical protein